MRGLLEAHHALLTHDVLHEVVQLPNNVTDYDELPASLGLPSDACVGVRIYLPDQASAGRGGATAIGLVVPAGVRPRADTLTRIRPDAQWRPARPEEINALTDYQAGLVCPFGLPTPIPLLGDHSLARAGVLYCATGEGGTAIGIHARDLLRVASVQLVPLLAEEIPDWIAPAAPRT